MSDPDPARRADELDGEADKLGQQSEQLEHEVRAVREDWHRKREDSSVPGAVPHPPDPSEDDPSEDDPSAEQDEGSPAPEAPPEESGPSAAEAPAEGAAGPPADQND